MEGAAKGRQLTVASLDASIASLRGAGPITAARLAERVAEPADPVEPGEAVGGGEQERPPQRFYVRLVHSGRYVNRIS